MSLHVIWKWIKYIISNNGQTSFIRKSVKSWLAHTTTETRLTKTEMYSACFRCFKLLFVNMFKFGQNEHRKHCLWYHEVAPTIDICDRQGTTSYSYGKYFAHFKAVEKIMHTNLNKNTVLPKNQCLVTGPIYKSEKRLSRCQLLKWGRAPRVW